MKIDRTFAGNMYKSNLKKSADVKTKVNQTEKLHTKDTVVISKQATTQHVIDRVLVGYAKDIDHPASPEKLEQLKQAVADGKYYVDSSDIADSILVRC